MARRTILRSPAAEDDLIDIWLYIALDSPRAADALLDRIAERVAILADFPEAGSIRPDIAEGLRMLPVGNHVVLYRVTDSRIEIIRVVHGARDASTLL